MSLLGDPWSLAIVQHASGCDRHPASRSLRCAGMRLPRSDCAILGACFAVHAATVLMSWQQVDARSAGFPSTRLIRRPSPTGGAGRRRRSDSARRSASSCLRSSASGRRCNRSMDTRRPPRSSRWLAWGCWPGSRRRSWPDGIGGGSVRCRCCSWASFAAGLGSFSAATTGTGSGSRDRTLRTRPSRTPRPSGFCWPVGSPGVCSSGSYSHRRCSSSVGSAVADARGSPGDERGRPSYGAADGSRYR